MKKLDAESPETKSADIISGNVEVLKSLFPDAFTEGKIDFEVLKQLLGGSVDEREEKYGLNWHGKRRARQIALTPSAGTLLPCPEESVDWDTTQNLMIEGDNLEVLKLLQKSYAGRVKMIYIDPPYNTGKDFVYPDDFRDSIKNYMEMTGQIEGGKKISSNMEVSGRFHTDWLNMVYPRLKLARSLMREDGLIFISIDDGEFERLRQICSEIFGEENYIATFVWKRKAGGGDDSGHVAAEHEYIVCFSRDAGKAGVASVLHESPAMTAKYNRSENGRRYYLERLDKTSLTYNSSMDFPIECPDGTFVKPPQPDPKNPTTSWRWGETTVKERRAELEFFREKGSGEWRVYSRTWESLDGVTPRSLMVEKEHGRNRDGTQEIDNLIGPKIFNNPKPTKMLLHLMRIGAKDKDALVLDFFAGSGSTAHAVMKLNSEDGGNRRYIMVQLPEVTDRADFSTIAAITRRRLRAAADALRTGPIGQSDLGFRTFKLTSSNIRAWEPNASDLEDSLLKNAEHLVQGRKEQDVLYELLLKLGLDLCVSIETKTIAGKTVHSIGGGTLIVCLADGLTKDVVEELANGIVEWRKAQAPAVDTRVVFKDTGFADDIAKTNMAAILNQAGIADVRSL
ncbi:adenine-specific DNA-methyltransferase [Pseudoxanthobacter soli DSM 19599]|uniref:site-specific DNA-methyltransferase (adenine-specific) n=1 Tax=Pseudoxanthobacter soli DSM 19599 TaxID=1123029 RepID=A0A1M7Z8S2_9HYPH|nr:site-specific DNA-methyltransferase [Pseudoxanthobacter soli]SHO61192.1 adenine-specific DNA-methyltransferase [Pseudoxanthobacter soli DSM 19599]